ncbi:MULTISPECIES: DUF6766 family protein [unclassified Nocardioides]|uniref:DUF6766 family protein n=1 Tax=unclassified Nocardioides TaxID=2615069 RepID=UPI00360BC102
MSAPRRLRTFLRENSLSLFFLVLFLVSLVGQAFAGWKQFNSMQVAEGLGTVPLDRYLLSANFAVDVTENWQSEYLQFLTYLMATVWLLQKGSPESKPLDMAGRETQEEQRIGEHSRSDSPRWARHSGGLRLRLYSSSLLLVMGGIFLASWLMQSIGGWATYNESRLQQLQDPIPWTSYLVNADFWSRTLQNWQSEFLAVGSMAVLAIYLRQRGSSQSKPVGMAHDVTGIEG